MTLNVNTMIRSIYKSTLSADQPLNPDTLFLSIMSLADPGKPCRLAESPPLPGLSGAL